MVILKKTKILTGLGMVVLLLLSFGVYGMYKAKAFIEGPSITIESPPTAKKWRNHSPR